MRIFLYQNHINIHITLTLQYYTLIFRVTTTEEVVTKISKKEEASPAMGGGVGGEGEKGSTKTKQ
ncbi:BnaCnng52040D [Brassica napus]|uniref:BnaCnng52040D protein n=2 Tax=Brassica TaxID=3705 RepID=A0A078JGH0_BRANA|nr:BnaCnng52040D [Brassica napus]VDD14639.1 unnamed protein product [Brassica oleracea]